MRRGLLTILVIPIVLCMTACVPLPNSELMDMAAQEMAELEEIWPGDL